MTGSGRDFERARFGPVVGLALALALAPPPVVLLVICLLLLRLRLTHFFEGRPLRDDVFLLLNSASSSAYSASKSALLSSTSSRSILCALPL